MAVVAAPHFQSRLDIWGPGTIAAHPLESVEQMTDIMPYQYPPPSPNGNIATLPHPGYLPADYSGITTSSGLGQDPHFSPKDRHGSMSSMSKGSMNINMNRAMSTPDEGSPEQMSQSHLAAQQDHALGLAADKRRNKLGYHRTSVACGHCRRRKIRCIPSPADVQGRCVNCIRLKKECSFYPVDQQPPADVRKSSSSRSSVGLPPSSLPLPKMGPPLPSRFHNLSLADILGPRSQQDCQKDSHKKSQLLTMPSIQTMGPPSMKSPESEAYSPDPKMTSSGSGRSFEYNHGGMTNWMSAEVSPGVSKPGELSATWRSYPHESPITPAFSPYTPQAPLPSATWAPHSDSIPRDDMGWSYPPPPPRSMSFAADNISGHHAQYPSIAQMAGGQPGRSYDRKSGSMPAMYQTPITTVPGVDRTSGSTLDHHASLSAAGATSSQAYGGWQQYTYGKPGDTNDAYIGWDGHGTTPAASHPTSSGMYYSGR